MVCVHKGGLMEHSGGLLDWRVPRMSTAGQPFTSLSAGNNGQTPIGVEGQKNHHTGAVIEQERGWKKVRTKHVFMPVLASGASEQSHQGAPESLEIGLPIDGLLEAHTTANLHPQHSIQEKEGKEQQKHLHHRPESTAGCPAA